MADESQETRGLKEVLAGEILAKIEKGETADYNHIIITGDLDIKTINLKKSNSRPIITSQIIINNSQIRGKLNFKGAIIEK